MSHTSRRAPSLVLTALVLALLCGCSTFVPQSGSQSGAPPAAPGTSMPLRPRTKTSGCQASGALPDAACTPGAVFEGATAEQVCTPGYSRRVRDVTVQEKRQVYAEYGLNYPQARGAYEADHLVSLELGGSNDIANLWPEPAAPTPGFHDKDGYEDYLHQQVCSGKLSLSEAQRRIATDWLAGWIAAGRPAVQFGGEGAP